MKLPCFPAATLTDPTVENVEPVGLPLVSLVAGAIAPSLQFVVVALPVVVPMSAR